MPSILYKKTKERESQQLLELEGVSKNTSSLPRIEKLIHFTKGQCILHNTDQMEENKRS